MLVDSTRAGKRIPDALSKTVPIWCAVVNRAIARRFSGSLTSDWDNALYTPPGAVSGQEHHQIEDHLDDWVEALVVSISARTEQSGHFHVFIPLAIIVRSSTTIVPFETFVDHSDDHNFPISPWKRPRVPSSNLCIGIETN
jgi:Rit1 N-terminal domain